MADNSFTMRVNLDFTAATKQLQDFERRNSLGISASKAASSHLAASGGPISGLHLDELSRAFRNLSRTVQATASNFDRLSAPFGGTRARLQAATTAAYAAGSAGSSRTQSFLMALPGLTQLVGAVTAPFMNMFSTGFSTIQGNEKLSTDLGTLLGDDRAGSAFAERIREYAAATPYAQADLAGTAKMLVQYGAGVEETEKYIRQLGDISMGSSQSMQGLGLVLGQVRSQGRLTGQDLMQFINAGFNPLSVISEQTGRSMADLRDDMSRGAISFEMVAAAMDSATSEGGKFYKGAERGAKTLSGMLSTIKDNFGQAMASAIEANMDAIKRMLQTWVEFDWESVINVLTEIGKKATFVVGIANAAFQSFTSHAEIMKQAIMSLGAVIASLAFSKLTAAFTSLKVSIAAATSGVHGLANKINALGNTSAGASLKTALFAKGVEDFIRILDALWQFFRQKSIEADRKQGNVEADADYAALTARRREWKEAKKKAGDQYGKNAYATRMVDEAYARYREAGKKIEKGGYTGGVNGYGLSESIRKELGMELPAVKEASRSSKGSVTNYVNCGNTSSTVTNNINTDLKDLSSIIREHIDTILTSHLTVRTNLESMKVVAL